MSALSMHPIVRILSFWNTFPTRGNSDGTAISASPFNNPFNEAGPVSYSWKVTLMPFRLKKCWFSAIKRSVLVSDGEYATTTESAGPEYSPGARSHPIKAAPKIRITAPRINKIIFLFIFIFFCPLLQRMMFATSGLTAFGGSSFIDYYSS
ncbi:Uncharacterised protein [uncultured archaeon]|nr:Uncharacterised protein [uncultured archaeon]